MSQLRYICVIPVTIFIFIFSRSGFAIDNTGEDKLLFFPEARIAISFSTTSENNNSSSAILNRYVALDLLRYNLLAFSFSTYEIMNYGYNDSGTNFKSIYYDMEYINLRLDSPYGRASAFINHRCENYVNQYVSDETTLRWYGYGFKWESPGMMTGYKDRRYGYSVLSEND